MDIPQKGISWAHHLHRFLAFHQPSHRFLAFLKKDSPPRNLHKYKTEGDA